MNYRNTLPLVLMTSVLLLSACAATETSRSTGQVVDDSAIAAKVKTELLANDDTEGLSIDVEVYRDRVQLNGFVDSEAQKERAEAVADQVSGVNDVENNLIVTDGQRRTGEYLDDNTLFVAVNSALAGNKEVSALNIDVEVNRGVVSLGGFVDSDRQRRAAESAVKDVQGIDRLVNNIALK